jgi:hypothetical protein
VFISVGIFYNPAMIISYLSFLLFALFSITPATAAPEVVYGVDNRVDTFESKSALFKTLAKSTAAQIHHENIKLAGTGAELRGKSQGETFQLCKKERFYQQPVVAICSGFLVGPDVIVSAGHCFGDKEDCTQYRWVFDYKLDRSQQTNVTVEVSKVYKCKEVLERRRDHGFDYSIVRLDRAVADRSPVKLATEIKVGTPVVLIGYPSGMPQKVADGAVIKSVSENNFKANVDAFRINSGSSVFNAVTGDLLGILVSGQLDYKLNQEEQCNEVNAVSDSGAGEGISSYTQFATALKKFIK